MAVYSMTRKQSEHRGIVDMEGMSVEGTPSNAIAFCRRWKNPSPSLLRVHSRHRTKYTLCESHPSSCSLYSLFRGFPAVDHRLDPSIIGIKDIAKPDFGDPVDINPGEVPVFWACGVTPQSIVMNSKPPFAITHAPGYMLITDTKNVDLKG